MRVVSAMDPAAPGLMRAVMAEGGLAAYPTDTLYGLGVDARNASALHRLGRCKGRTGPFSSMLQAPEAVAEILLVSTAHVDKLLTMLPGPYTFIAPPREPALWPDLLTGGTGRLSVRVPEHPFLRQLYRDWKMPVVTTSVNLAGQPALDDPQAIAEQFEGQLDLLIDGGVLPPSKGSTIIDISAAEWQVIRQGDGDLPA